MSSVEQIERAILDLPRGDFERIADWVLDLRGRQSNGRPGLDPLPDDRDTVTETLDRALAGIGEERDPWVRATSHRVLERTEW